MDPLLSVFFFFFGLNTTSMSHFLCGKRVADLSLVREKLMMWCFFARVRAAEEKVRAIQLAAIAEFKSMLRERKEITSKSRWSKVDVLFFIMTILWKDACVFWNYTWDLIIILCFCFQVKEDVRSDKRYKAVKHEERETLFEEYVAELKAAEVEAEQSSKANLDEQVCHYSIYYFFWICIFHYENEKLIQDFFIGPLIYEICWFHHLSYSLWRVIILIV